MKNSKSTVSSSVDLGRSNPLNHSEAKAKRISMQKTARKGPSALYSLKPSSYSNSIASPPKKLLQELNLTKQKKAAYRAALDLEIRFLNYHLDPLSEDKEQRSIQNYFRNGRDIKRLIYICLTRGTLIGNGTTAKMLRNLTQSSRSYISERLAEIVEAGWGHRYQDRNSFRYFASKSMFLTWVKRYESIYQDFGRDSVVPNFLNHMVVSWGLFHIEQKTNVPYDDITDLYEKD